VNRLEDPQPPKPNRRNSRALKIGRLVVAAMLLALLANLTLGRLGEGQMLEKLLDAPLSSGQTVVQSETQRGVLFGDSAFAWKVASTGDRILLPSDYHESDDSDLRFAIQEIESLLQTKVTRPPERKVLRGERGGTKVYCVTEPGGHELFVLGIKN
jgi:hypothetical protein